MKHNEPIMLDRATATVRTTRIKICCCRRACGWLAENHLAYFVSDVIDQLDLPAMDEVYGREKRGQPPYDRRMMTKLLVYGYCVGVFSSRRIILLRSGVSQGSGTGVAASFSACAASVCASRSLICEQRSFSFFFIRSAHRLVRGGIGFDLRAVQRHPAHFQRTRFQRDLQNLLEESLQRLQMDLAKSDMVRMFG
jgi:hypothetical protein